ncbi:uncharacterized protein METZ01_LOCUS386244 [marine metagenome]|uniref:Uncharacterized protein n=1 Tax=marine metagenome TaxID=408172 RepID=A0A382UGN7_9ZZZZ
MEGFWGDFTWMVSDCEEFAGVTYRRSLGKSHDLS